MARAHSTVSASPNAGAVRGGPSVERHQSPPRTVRSYAFFLVANLAVLGVALGPAAVVGLTRLRDPGPRLLVGAGIAVVLVADLSGLSSAETERIWQPFMPLVLVAAVAAARGPRWDASRWLVLQALTALVHQPSTILFVTPTPARTEHREA